MYYGTQLLPPTPFISSSSFRFKGSSHHERKCWRAIILEHFLPMTAAFGTGGGMGAIHDLTFSV